MNDIHHDDLDDNYSHPAGDPVTPARPTAAEALAGAAFEAALTADADALLATRGYTLVLRVSGPDWVLPMRRAVREILPDAHLIGARERYDASSDDEVCALLAGGREIVGIAADLDRLPRALVRTADATLAPRLPVGDERRPVIAAVTGVACPPVPPDLAAGLGLAEAAAATAASGEKRDHDYRIVLATMPQPLGGRRWFFICPQLGVRVTKLYLPRGELAFASRQAHRLGYRSQRRTPHDQALQAAFKLRGRLGSDGGIGDYIPKPKWMRWATFERRMEKIRRAEAIATEHLAACLERLTRRNPIKRGVV